MIAVVAGALAIGLSLGLLGSGGSILTVPILHYLVGQPAKVAIAGSLLVVGAIAAAGGLQNVLRHRVHFRSVLWFGLPGMAGTWLGARMSALVTGTVQLLLFDAVMFTAAVRMLRDEPTAAGVIRRPSWQLLLNGLLIGVLTGFVGVGGGFLIVPALTLLAGLPMHVAVGTSLVIIALNSFSGFAKYVHELEIAGLELDYAVLGPFVAIGVLGALTGSAAGNRIPQATLRRAFAVLLLLASLGIAVAIAVG